MGWQIFEEESARHAQRHGGEDRAILAQRKRVYQRAQMENPARWSGDTRNWDWIPKVSLNPDKSTDRKSV